MSRSSFLIVDLTPMLGTVLFDLAVMVIGCNRDVFRGFYGSEERLGLWAVFEVSGKRAEALEFVFRELIRKAGVETKSCVRRATKIPSKMFYIQGLDGGD